MVLYGFCCLLIGEAVSFLFADKVGLVESSLCYRKDGALLLDGALV